MKVLLVASVICAGFGTCVIAAPARLESGANSAQVAGEGAGSGSPMQLAQAVIPPGATGGPSGGPGQTAQYVHPSRHHKAKTKKHVAPAK